ncbi:MAG: hypothetical protein E6G75_21120, partial [Alphaproteobacteria bacterium]
FETRAVDLVLSGHDHDLFIEFDGRNAMAESSYDAHYVTAIDVAINVKEENGRRSVTWWPQFRIIDTATVTPDPEVAAVVAKYEGELGKELDDALGTTAVALDSRTATVRTREAAIGNLVADAMRASTHADAAVTNGGGIRGGKVYPPGTELTARDVLTELPFDNRILTIEIAGAEPSRPTRAAPPETVSSRSKSATRHSMSARSIALRPMISWRAAATAIPGSVTPSRCCQRSMRRSSPMQ